MKKILILSSIGLFFLVAILVSMSNMNVLNLLIFGSEYSGGSAFEQFDVEEDKEGNDLNEEEETSDATLEALQSGLTAISGGGALNLLWLLQNAGEVNKESYAYQLLQIYSNNYAGKYNNHPYHITPEAIAGSHYNETKLASLAVPSVSGYGKANGGILGKTINGKKITLENAMRSDIVGNVSHSGEGVYTDVHGDGPDGPFQIEVFAQSNSYANKARGDNKYDGYNFVDALNFVDGKYSSIASSLAQAGVTADPRAVNILYGAYHNRGIGGMVYVLFGLPYTNQSSLYNEGNYLHNTTIEGMSAERMKDMLAFPEDLLEWFDKSNIPIEKIVGNNGDNRATALLLILKNGGFINKPIGNQTRLDIQRLDKDVIQKLFPGHDNNSIINHINANYVKKPWDVLGMSKSQYDKIYGTSVISSNYEEIYRNSVGQNTVFYIDKNVTSDNYKAGENVVVRALEGIVAGYMLDVGLNGAFVTLSIALEAGIKSLTDGTVVDPSDPSAFYVTIQEGAYNPAAEATGDYGKFLDAVGLNGKLTETQQAQIKALYDVSGGPYSQGSRFSDAGNGALVLDCSSMCAIGMYLGDVATAKKESANTRAIRAGLWQRNTKQTAEVNGKKYTAKTVQLDKNGKPMEESNSVQTSAKYSRTDSAWLPYLQTGDIVNGVGANGGHVFTYLTQNKTGKNMVIEQHISKVGARFSKYKPNEHLTMQAAYYAHSYDAGKMGLMPLMPDTSYAQYQAFRPVYNLN